MFVHNVCVPARCRGLLDTRLDLPLLWGDGDKDRGERDWSECEAFS